MRKQYTIYILPGGSGRNDGHWYSWLAGELKKRHLGSVIVCAQNRLNPSLRAQQLEDRFTLDQNSIIIGHSFGGLTAMKWLELARTHVAGLILVDASVKTVFQAPQKGKIEKIRKRYLHSWDWKMNVAQAAKYVVKGGVLSERRTEKSYAAWLPGQKKYAQALHCQVMSLLGKKQHFTARKEPAVLRTVLKSIST